MIYTHMYALFKIKMRKHDDKNIYLFLSNHNTVSLFTLLCILLLKLTISRSR